MFRLIEPYKRFILPVVVILAVAAVAAVFALNRQSPGIPDTGLAPTLAPSLYWETFFASNPDAPRPAPLFIPPTGPSLAPSLYWENFFANAVDTSQIPRDFILPASPISPTLYWETFFADTEYAPKDLEKK